MSFKFDSHTAFLTYPHCDLQHDEVINALRVIQDIAWARVCLERHEDGQPHVHVVCKFTKRVQSRQQRVFDISTHHPNIQRVRSIAHAIEYCAKDGNYRDYGDVPTSRAKRMEWNAIVEAAKGDPIEWHRVCHEQRIQGHVAEGLRKAVNSASVDLDEYDNRPVGEALAMVPTQWTSLLLVGHPGIGKTGWAMQHCPRPCLLVKHLDVLRQYRDGYHKSILFDDCDFKHLPRTTQLMLSDYENRIMVHVRYGVAVIPPHVPRLFLCNYGCEPFIDDIAIQGRRLSVILL